MSKLSRIEGALGIVEYIVEYEDVEDQVLDDLAVAAARLARAARRMRETRRKRRSSRRQEPATDRIVPADDDGSGACLAKLAKLRSDFPGAVLLFLNSGCDRYSAWNEDADLVAEVANAFGIVRAPHPPIAAFKVAEGLRRCWIDIEPGEEVALRLVAEGRRVAVVKQTQDGRHEVNLATFAQAPETQPAV